MARARRLVRNPAIPRLEWVAKNYPDAVWVLTVLGFMEAAAMDDAREWVADEADVPVLDWKTLGKDVAYFGHMADGVNYQIREYEAENTEYDRYIPWLAKSLNRVTKKPIKELKKILGRAYPGMKAGPGGFFAVEQFVPEVGITQEDVDRMNAGNDIVVDAFSIFYGVRGSVLNDAIFDLKDINPDAHLVAQDLFDRARNDVRDLISSFGTVARWAEGAGVNLDDYEPIEAVRLAKEWAARQPKDPNIVAGDVIYEFDDGWTFQELTTRTQFMCEGKYLDHCVKGYKPSKVGVVYRIFSLRDAEGRPVATLRWEIDGEYVSQYYGMSNRVPGRDELLRGAEFRLNYLDQNLVTLPRTDDWDTWKSGANLPIPRDDFLVKQLDRLDIALGDVQTNPAKRNKTPEYKRLLNRAHRLWEAYDAKPLKKNLVAFGKHIERMKVSESAKVKVEARRAARAFNAEFKARGWKK